MDASISSISTLPSAPSAQRRPWRCARRAGSLRDAGASTFVICVCLWPSPFSKGNRLTGHQCDKLRPSLAATSKRRQWKPRGRPGSAWPMERPARDGTSDTSSCQAPGRAGVKGGGASWLAAQRPSGCRGRAVDGQRRATQQGLFPGGLFPNFRRGEAPHPWTMGSRLSVRAGQLAGTRGAVQIDAGGEGGREQAVHY